MVNFIPYKLGSFAREKASEFFGILNIALNSCNNIVYEYSLLAYITMVAFSN